MEPTRQNLLNDFVVAWIWGLSREHVLGDGNGRGITLTLTGKGSTRRLCEIVLFQDARAQVVLKRDARVLLRVQMQIIKVRLL